MAAKFGVFRMIDETESERGDIVRFTATPQMWKYLGWLARHTLLGKTEHEVAKQLLTTKLTKMRREKYRDDPRDV